MKKLRFFIKQIFISTRINSRDLKLLSYSPVLILLLFATSVSSQDESGSAIVCGKILINPDSIFPYKPRYIILQKDWPISFKQFEQQEIDTTDFSFKIEMDVNQLSYGEIYVSFFRDIDSTTLLHNGSRIWYKIPSDFMSDKYVRTVLNPRFVIEPGDSLYIVFDYDNPGLYNQASIRFTGKGGANNNHLREKDHFRSFNKSFKLPLEEGLENVDRKMIDKLRDLDEAKDSISGGYYSLLKKDILFKNLKQKHALIRASLYGQNTRPGEKRSIARERYAYMDTLTLRTEYLNSFQFRGFLDFYLEYLNRIITGKDVPFLNNDKSYWLAKGVFSNEILKTFLYEKLIFKMETPNFYNHEAFQYQDFINTFPNTPESYRLTEIYKKHYPVSNGQYAPELVLADSTGKKKNLSQLKGKVVMITTGPYLYDIKKKKSQVKELHRKFGDDIVLIFLKTPFKKVSRLSSTIDYSVSEENNPQNYYHYYFLRSSEYNFIINKRGKIIASPCGFDASEAIISELISEKYNLLTRLKYTARNHIVEIVVILSLFVSLTLGLLIISRLRQRRQELIKMQLNSELKAIRSQLNPHFLFNSLNSLQNYINKSDSKSANMHLSKFAMLMRRVIELSEKESTTLKEELSFNKTYIALEQVRYGFKCNFDIDNSIDHFNTEIPTMIIQPFIENAIIHCMADLGTKGELSISVEKKDEDKIIIVITDNGKGFSAEPGKGFGLKSSRERIDLLNAKNRDKIELIIESPVDKQAKRGSAVTLIIPKRY